MPETKGPIPYLDLVNGGLGQVLTLLPLAFTAYKLLHSIWASGTPGLTFEEYNAKLLAASDKVDTFAETWLTTHGYQKQADGSWTAPGA